eukprot:TCONS_00025918-protein
MNEKQSIALVNDQLKIRPYVNKSQLKDIALKCFGFELDEGVEPMEMVSYEDRNFRIQGRCTGEKVSRCFVMKIFNRGTSNEDTLEHIINLILYSKSKCSQHFAVQTPIPSISSSDQNMKYISSYNIPILPNASYDDCTKSSLIEKGLLDISPTGQTTCCHNIRLLTYLEGRPPKLSEEKVTDEFAQDWGATSGRLCNALEEVPKSEKVDREKSICNLITVGKYLKSTYLEAVKHAKQKQTFTDIIEKFETQILPQLEKNVKKSYIHGDINEVNLLLDSSGKIGGVIDFDDAVWSFSIVDLAISFMHFSLYLDENAFTHKMKKLYQGYTSARQITDLERDLLYDITLMSYAQWSVLASHQYHVLDPGNKYIHDFLQKSWQGLSLLLLMSKDMFLEKVCTQ